MDVARFLNRLKHHPNYHGQLAHVETLPARSGRYAQPDDSLPPTLIELLARRGIDRLYTHQVQSLECARKGLDWVVVTGTASGKTLCYNLPILESCLTDPEARAVYLFPTKALAQDQLRGLLELLSEHEATAQQVKPGVYDGDTPASQRRRIKAEANLVLTNPDMLHASILPYHPKWAHFFSHLRYVVIDEVHTYRGILGAHVACVLRRLQRVCAHYGSRPLFLSASATIANPGELTSQLIGRDVEVIDDDGAPRGPRHFAIWNPSASGHDRLARGNPTDDAVWLMGESIRDGAQSLAFTRTRQAAELVNRYVQDDLRNDAEHLAGAMRAYRGGYLPNERRQIEQQLASGNLRGVATTNALELGVDIGSLDVALLVHYPGTIASTWQQAGRAGRQQDASLAILITSNDPVDQYLSRHPEYFFSQSPEHAVVDPENPYVLANHLRAASFELPLEADEATRFGESASNIVTVLCEAEQLAEIDGKAYFAGGQNPSHEINLRHISDDTFSIVLVDARDHDISRLADSARDTASVTRRYKRFPHPTNRAQLAPAADASNDNISRKSRTSRVQETGRGLDDGGPGHTRHADQARHQLPESYQVIANVDAISAPELVYPEAVYLHHGETYLVRELDLGGKVAYVERCETDYYTQAVLDSSVLITKQQDTKPYGLPDEPNPLAEVAFGDVDVSWKTVGFKKIKFDTRENVGYGQVDIPAQNLVTTGLWLTPSDAVRSAMKAERLRISNAMCGLRNLAVVALPMVAMCDSRDISGVIDSKNIGVTTMILYDRYPGGLGYCEKGYQCIPSLLSICYQMIAECNCEDGCPSCVGLPNLRPAIHSDPDLMRDYPLPEKKATQRLLELLGGHGVMG